LTKRSLLTFFWEPKAKISIPSLTVHMFLLSFFQVLLFCMHRNCLDKAFMESNEDNS
jgi:hypothetical protein